MRQTDRLACLELPMGDLWSSESLAAFISLTRRRRREASGLCVATSRFKYSNRKHRELGPDEGVYKIIVSCGHLPPGKNVPPD